MLQIAVCVKQVPSGQAAMNQETGNLERGESAECMNMYDYAAVETALQIRKIYGGEVDVFTMGPPKSEQAVREALALGADHAVLLSDPAFAGADVFATAYTLSRALSTPKSYDLILCGKQTTDGDTAQVSGTLAGSLDIPYIPWAQSITEVTKAGLTAETILDGKCVTVYADFPCLISVLPSIYPAGIPTLMNRMKSRKAAIEVRGADALRADVKRCGKSGSATQVMKIERQPVKEKQKPVSLQAEAFITCVLESCEKVGV